MGKGGRNIISRNGSAPAGSVNTVGGSGGRNIISRSGGSGLFGSSGGRSGLFGSLSGGRNIISRNGGGLFGGGGDSGWSPTIPANGHSGHHHGVGGLFHNFGSDLEHAVTGIPTGVEVLGSGLGHDAKKFAEHPIGYNPKRDSQLRHTVVEPLAQNYGQTYGPLVHGHVNEFLHQVYGHPLGPILDLATLVTGGAGAIGKAGSALAKTGEVASRVGAISDTGRVAQIAAKAGELGKAKDLTVPGFNPDERVIVRRTSRNPAVAARQRAVNAGLNKLPANTPGLGSTARVAKALKHNTELEANRLTAKLIPHQKAYARLNAEGQAAFHLVANGVHPQELGDYWRAQKAQGFPISDGALKVVDNPKVHELVNDIREPHPGGFVSVSGKNNELAKALTEGKKVSDLMTAEKVRRGLISEGAQAERPYFTMRVANGARYVEPTAAKVGKVSDRLAAHRAYVDRLQRMYDRQLAKATAAARDSAKKIEPVKSKGEPTAAVVGTKVVGPGKVVGGNGSARLEKIGGALSLAKDKLQSMEAAAAKRVEPTGLVDQPGRDIGTLAHELAAQGRPQPFYLPMKAEVNNAWRNGRPLHLRTNPTTIPGSPVKGLRGTLLQHGLLSFHDTLSPDYLKMVRYARRADLHDALMQHAVRLHPDVALPHGYTFLKSKTGEHIGYTEQVRGQFEHDLKANEPFDFRNLFTTKNPDAPEIAADHLGGRLIVPERAVHELQDEVRHIGPWRKWLLSNPTTAWKHLVLGLRPGFGVNLTVGNHVLSMLQAPSLVKFFDSYLRQASRGRVSRFLGGKIDKATMEDVFPEQSHAASFGASEGMGPSASRNILKRASKGVMPATIRVENFLRAALTESWARDTPEIRAAMRHNGGDINAAIRDVARTHPQIRNEISRRVDAALGNYRTYNRTEQAVRALIPFYAWDKHIVRSTGRVVGEFPHRANALRLTGDVGSAKQDATLGPLPSYMQGDIRLPGLPKFMGPLNGRTPVLDTHSLNPFNTDRDLANFAASLVHGHAGQAGGELASGINPFVQALVEQVTGRSLLTGQQIKGGHDLGLANVIPNTFGNVPQATLAKAVVDALRGKSKPTAPNKLYQSDLQTLLADFLGANVKKVGLNSAHVDASKGY